MLNVEINNSLCVVLFRNHLVLYSEYMKAGDDWIKHFLVVIMFQNLY